MQAWVRSGTTALIVLLLAASGVTLAEEVTTIRSAVQAAAGSPATAGAGGIDRPNIVFVMTDDMREDDLRWMPHTRSLLADRGMDFTDAISPHPLCCPARAQLVTGQYAQNNGVQHNAGPFGGFQALDPTHEISSWFKQGGYQTGFVGKFLNGYTARDVRPSGWDHWDALSAGVYDYFDFAFDNDGEPGDLSQQLRHRRDRRADQRDRPRVRPRRRPVPRLLLAPRAALPHQRPGHARAASRVTQGQGPLRPGRSALLRLGVVQRAQRRSTSPGRSAPDGWPTATSSSPSTAPGCGRCSRSTVRSSRWSRRCAASMSSTTPSSSSPPTTATPWVSTASSARTSSPNETLQVPLLVRGPGIGVGTTSDLPVTLVDLPATFTSLAAVQPGWLLDGLSVRADPARSGPALPGHDPRADR